MGHCTHSQLPDKAQRMCTLGVVEARRRLDLKGHLLAVVDAPPAPPLLPQLNARRLQVCSAMVCLSS